MWSDFKVRQNNKCKPSKLMIVKFVCNAMVIYMKKHKYMCVTYQRGDKKPNSL